MQISITEYLQPHALRSKIRGAFLLLKKIFENIFASADNFAITFIFYYALLKTLIKDFDYVLGLDLDKANENSKKFSQCSEEEIPNKSTNSRPLIADFTEYSPLHNGHFHCMKTAKEKIPDGLFVAVVPGLFERSGRGLPYILHRKILNRIKRFCIIYFFL